MSKKRLWLMLLLLVIAVSAGLSQPTDAATTSWQASYWNNKGLTGTPVLERAETDLNYNWGSGAPAAGVNADNFSARWTRTLNVTPGTYRIEATADDGIRVWVDGALVIDSWQDGAARTLAVDRYLAGGDHELRVEYYEAFGLATARLTVRNIEPYPDWKGEYFANSALTGTPVVVRNDPAIAFDWGTGAPAAQVPADRFSVRWTRSLNFAAGRYTFTLAADDGARLWVNGQLIIDRWYDQQAVPQSATVDLPAGTIALQLDYYENQGGAVARLSWLPLDAGTWRGEYFNNKTLSGTPALVRDDAQIDFNWGGGSPATGINADNFSVRWTRSLSFPTGRYQFSATSNDGVRLWVNDRLLIDKWYDHPAEAFSAEIDLPNGTASLRMEFYEGVGTAQARLTWRLVGNVPVVPTPTPTPTPRPTATVAVNATYINFRSGPGPTYTVLRQFPRGTVLPVGTYRNALNTWVQVVAPDGTVGWVYVPLTLPSTTLSTLPVWPGDPNNATVPDGMARVTARVALNVRTGPGLTYAIKTTVRRDQLVVLTGYRDSGADWVQIRLGDGSTGWASTRYLERATPFSNLTVWTGR